MNVAMANTNTQPKLLTFSGTVERIKAANEFVLRDNKGIINVRIASEHPPILNEGDVLTITGVRKTQHPGIDAHNIDVDERSPV